MHQDALNRVRTLTGGVMIMACPVLLAIAVNKVNPKTGMNKLALGIVWMAASTLEAGICPFVTLWLSNATASLCPRISGYLFAASKLLVHLCAMLLMALAYGILLLISMGNLAYMCLLIVFALPTLFLCYLSVQNSPVTTDLTNNQSTATASTNNQSTATASTNNQTTVTASTNNQTTATASTNNQTTATASTNNQTTATASTNNQTTATAPTNNQTTATASTNNAGDRRQKQVTMLENLVEFSVAGTSILFLGLEGLALERLSRNATAPPTLLDRGLLDASLGLSFFTCLLGVLVVLPGVVPPPQLMTGVKGDSATMFVEILNIVLAIFIGMTVVLIASATVKALAWLAVVPALVSFVSWMLVEAFDRERVRQDVKPASLDLTKVTFTGFLAVSVMAIGNARNHHQVSFYEQAFIVLTSAAVVAGIGWRLFTHRTTGRSRAVVVAANAASVCAHACVALAVVPFAVMAFKRGAAAAGAAGPAAPH